MNVHPLADITLNAVKFNVTGKIVASYQGLGAVPANLSVVEVALGSLETILANDFDPNTLREDKEEAEIAQTKEYEMPLVDVRPGSTVLMWYGNSHALRALRGATIGAKTVAFVATSNALQVLNQR